jgi:hypothetical protein
MDSDAQSVEGLSCSWLNRNTSAGAHQHQLEAGLQASQEAIILLSGQLPEGCPLGKEAKNF